MRYLLILIILLLGSGKLLCQSIKLMSFNIRYDNPNDNENSWDNRKNEVVGLIDYYQPDIIGIQEGLLDQVEYILQNTSNYSYIGVGRDDGIDRGEFSAIYYDTTEYEVISQKTFWLSDTPEKVSVGWDASMERICTYGRFSDKATGKNMYVFNAHFDHMGKQSRNKSVKLILSKIKQLKIADSAVIVMGDLNCGPNSIPIKVLSKELNDPLNIIEEKSVLDIPGTFNSFDPNIIPQKRIDYIFTKNLDIVMYTHINDKRKNGLCISDHLPVIIEIDY